MGTERGGGEAGGRALTGVEVWLFDLDNTLYPASCDLFPLIERRMGAFIAERFGVSLEEARRRQKRFFRDYGTTLRGLMVEYGVEPQLFLDYVHAIDLGSVAPSPALARGLTALPGRKLIFTNASRDHAERVMARLGVTGLFEAVYDIADAGYRPKPDPAPYAGLLARHGVDPARACMLDDMARNLVPAAGLGMITVWIRTDSAWGRPGPEDRPHIDHVIDDLPGWLAGLTGLALDGGARKGADALS
ncbi:MAG: pyrimidine 5'-nucleotidase [Rhodospirillaceae bacterium]